MMARENIKNGNSAFIKTLLLYLSLVLGGTSLVKNVFFSGGEQGRMEQHIEYLDTRLTRGEAEWARKPEVGLQILSLEKTQEREEATLKDLAVKVETQNHLLDQIQVAVDSRRR